VAINQEDYIKAIKGRIIQPVFRLSLLNQDESVRETITDDIIYGSGALSINYQQGQRRSLNFALNNTNGKWTPNPNSNYMWVGTKFRLDLGIKITQPSYVDIIDGGYSNSLFTDTIDGGTASSTSSSLINGGTSDSMLTVGDSDTFWTQNGIFVIGDPNVTHNNSDKQVSIQCYDKFALLDGTLGGNTDGTYTIPVGTTIRQAIIDTLMSDNGTGYPIDIKPVIFDSKYSNTVTSYTITKSPNSSLGEILIELANMISCDIYYNENGNLVVQSGIDDISHINKPTLWSYNESELEYLNSNLTSNFTKIKNRVVIVATNVNTNVTYSAVSENTNPLSPTRVSKIVTNTYYLEDNNISSTALAQDRADYELNKLAIVQLTNNLQSTYMTQLDVNNCISVNDSYFGFEDDRFIIQSINVPIEIDCKIDIKASNIADLPFYNTTS
jgi:hypothetical protein